MGIYDTFSKRKRKQEQAGKTDVFIYDEVPNKFRVQVVQILENAIGPYFKPTAFNVNAKINNNRGWESIFNILRREMGVFTLSSQGDSPKEQCVSFVLAGNVEEFLDILELSLRLLKSYTLRPHYKLEAMGITQQPKDAIEEINKRFLENGLGYEFDGEIVRRVDSQLIHSEVVKSALTLIHDEAFSGAEDEFRKAYEHYRHCRNKEALNEALKALESAAKCICNQHGWEYSENAQAKQLIDTLFKNQLIPPELESHYSAIRAVLESGVPTVRNRQGGHGQGEEVKTVPPHIVAFALHSTASALVFLVQASRTKRKQ
jgi:hypothetical protein